MLRGDRSATVLRRSALSPTIKVVRETLGGFKKALRGGFCRST